MVPDDEGSSCFASESNVSTMPWEEAEGGAEVVDDVGSDLSGAVGRAPAGTSDLALFSRGSGSSVGFVRSPVVLERSTIGVLPLPLSAGAVDCIGFC
jgi:hypothetical protein